MPELLKIWDRDADEGRGGFVELYSLTAKEAIANDPKRYSPDKPSTAREVNRTEAPPPPVAVEIPDRWQELPWHDRKKLAKALGADNKADADTVEIIIAAEVRRRSALTAAKVDEGAGGEPAEASKQEEN